MKPLCIYHGNCADGFTAAWVVRRKFEDRFDFHAGVHGDPPPDVAGRHVVIVDFSYKRPVLEAMAASALSVLILDHHKSAQEALADLPPPPPDPYGRREKGTIHVNLPPGSCAIFDMKRSGAQIAWDYFFGSISRRPQLVDYVGDRDLWRFKMPFSREVSAYIFSHEYDFKQWDRLASRLGTAHGRRAVAQMGGAIDKKHHKDVAELVGETQRRMILGGHSVPVANLPYTLSSDAGHLMAQGEPFAACYWDTPSGRVFSLRSTDSGLDVSEIARMYGGGGHRNASGFRMPLGWEGDTVGDDVDAAA